VSQHRDDEQEGYCGRCHDWTGVVTIETHCPRCGRGNPLHSGKHSDDVPVAGDVSICFKCRTVGVFDTGPFGALLVRLPTAEEQQQIDSDPQVKRALGALAESYDPMSAVHLWREP
jgi:hypothetical protein